MELYLDHTGLQTYKALASETRLEILKLLANYIIRAGKPAGRLYRKVRKESKPYLAGFLFKRQINTVWKMNLDLVHF